MGIANEAAVEIECLECGTTSQVAWRTQGGMVVRRCPKCHTVDLLFTAGIYGVITDKPDNIKRIKAQLTEKDTLSWTHLRTMMDKIRVKMGNGQQSERMCVFCDDEPHNTLRPCPCECHPIRAWINSIQGRADGELEQRVA